MKIRETRFSSLFCMRFLFSISLFLLFISFIFFRYSCLILFTLYWVIRFHEVFEENLLDKRLYHDNAGLHVQMTNITKYDDRQRKTKKDGPEVIVRKSLGSFLCFLNNKQSNSSGNGNASKTSTHQMNCILKNYSEGNAHSGCALFICLFSHSFPFLVLLSSISFFWHAKDNAMDCTV